jgi:hypothetical protein
VNWNLEVGASVDVFRALVFNESDLQMESCSWTY